MAVSLCHLSLVSLWEPVHILHHACMQAHVRNNGHAKANANIKPKPNRQTDKQKPTPTKQEVLSYPKTGPISNTVTHQRWKQGETSSCAQCPLSSAPRHDSVAPLTTRPYQSIGFCSLHIQGIGSWSLSHQDNVWQSSMYGMVLYQADRRSICQTHDFFQRWTCSL